MAESTGRDSSIPTTTGAGATEPGDESGLSIPKTGEGSSIPTSTGAGATEGPGAGEEPTTSGAKGTLPASGEIDHSIRTENGSRSRASVLLMPERSPPGGAAESTWGSASRFPVAAYR